MLPNSVAQSDLTGILPRAVHDLFDILQSEEQEYECVVRMSYLQIYMEVIQDLLLPESSNLQIREDKSRIYVEGLSEHRVRHLNDVLLLLDFGERTRTKAPTKLNAKSSRSHTVFILNLEKKHKKSSRRVTAKFMCCDLAGMLRY